MSTTPQKKESLLPSARDLVSQHTVSILAVMAFAAIVSAATLFHSVPAQAMNKTKQHEYP